MNLRHIRIFLEVINCGNSISAASRKLLISQPSISVAIQELEAECSVPLFDRLSRRLYLTEAGRRFEEHARKIAASLDDLEKEMQSWNSTGILRVGGSITVGSQFMPGYAAEYKKRRPDIRLNVLIDHSRHLERMLLNNELDLAVIETQVHDDGLSSRLFRESGLDVIVPPDGSFPDGEFSLDEFCACPILLRESGSGTREVFDQVMQEKGRTVEPVWVANSTTALISAVSRGLGISVIPHEAAKDAAMEGKIRFASVKGLTFTQRFYLVHHRDKLLTPYMTDFIETVLSNEGNHPIG